MNIHKNGARTISTLVLIWTLCGCAHHPLDCATDFVPHEDCMPGTAGYDSAQKRTELAATKLQLQQGNDDETCKSFGLKFGSSDYATCRERLLSMRTDQTSAANNANAQAKAAIAAALLQQQANRSAPLPDVPPATVTTNCIANGNSLNCQSR